MYLADVCRLSSDLPDSMRMPRTVPHSLRGMALGQLNLLDKLFLSSGWLEQQCRLHNEQHDAAIQSGTVFKQLPNLYAMDTHIVTPMSKPGHCLARDQDRSKSIPDALWARSFSELLNPNGCFIHFFVSHYWGHLFQKTLAALRIWAGNRSDGVGAGNPDSVVYWICLFALNQHRVAEEVGELPMQGPFNAALAHATGGAVMVLDEEVHPFRRIWCLFEVHRLDQLNQRFELICEKGPLAVLHEAVNEADRQAADKMLDDIANALWNASALKAQASNGDDLVSILDVIRDSPEHLLTKELDRKSEDGGTVFVLNPPEEPETTKGGSSKYHETTMVEMYSFHRFDEKVHALLSTPLLDRCLACENVAHARECLLHGARFTKETVVRFLALSQAHDQETQEILDDLLVVASEQGYAEEAAVLLSIGASAKGSKSIVAASARGHAPVVKLLVEAGANVTEDDLLMRAAGGGHAEVVKLLLEAGAPVSGMREGEVLLLNASCGGHDAVVKMLLEAGPTFCKENNMDNAR